MVGGFQRKGSLYFYSTETAFRWSLRVRTSDSVMLPDDAQVCAGPYTYGELPKLCHSTGVRVLYANLVFLPLLYSPTPGMLGLLGFRSCPCCAPGLARYRTCSFCSPHRARLVGVRILVATHARGLAGGRDRDGAWARAVARNYFRRTPI